VALKVRILVTGGAGFLGSHLVDALIADSHHVIALDDLSTGSLKNIEHHFGNDKFEFMEHDVTQEYSVKVDAVLNFACPASPVQYQINPIQTLLTSTIGTLNALKVVRQNSAILVHASTSEVYGDPEISPQSEDYVGKVNPIGPRACYDEGKRSAETAIYDFIRIHNVDARVVRIFNTYGPRMSRNDGRVVSNFIVSAIENSPITIYGDGSQTRSFCYVSDTINGILKMLYLPTRPDTPINIGNPHEITMNELSTQIIKLTTSISQIEQFPLPQDDPKQRCPDISRAKKTLDWSPQIQLSDGLTETVNYFKSKS
jgi:UDP-glucuronate decarboxylase